MDLSNFVTYDKKGSHLLNNAKSILNTHSKLKILLNTHSKPQETLEFKMTSILGVTSLEVYNTVYKITNSNEKLKFC